jgi:hypothetical protein
MSYTIVGLKYYIKEWGDLQLNSTVVLTKEKNNKYDKNAISCYFNDKKIGYVSKMENKNCKPGNYKVIMKRGLSQPILLEVEAK